MVRHGSLDGFEGAWVWLAKISCPCSLGGCWVQCLDPGMAQNLLAKIKAASWRVSILERNTVTGKQGARLAPAVNILRAGILEGG